MQSQSVDVFADADTDADENTDADRSISYITPTGLFGDHNIQDYVVILKS